MGADPKTNKIDTPGIQAMLPLLYAAWADRHLNLKEINALRKRAGELDFLTAEDRTVLLEWSDPARPPSRELFQTWQTAGRGAAEQLPEDKPARLAELGVLLGSTPERSLAEYLPALLAIEKGLGGVSEDTYRGLFPLYDQRAKLQEAVDGASVPAEELYALFTNGYGQIINKTKEILLRPSFERPILRIKEAQRDKVMEWTRELAAAGIGALAYPVAYGGRDDMAAYAHAFETIGLHDLSLTIKFGVQFGLWGGAIHNLGTKDHHDKYLAETGRLDIPGCFAMTETGHGSNVRGLETTAVYDHDTRELIVHSPSIAAGKEYIGNAMHSTMAAVFCQLIVNGESHGVHAVVVPIRDDEHNTLPGITVKDNGYKMGLNGVDNGRLWFDNVRVPVDNLLDRFGGINAGGDYESPIENPSRRFFTMLGTLVGGRVCVPRAGMAAAKSALTIATRYNLRRRQFAADPLKAETIILDYPNQQRRLIPLIAEAYCLQFGLDYLLDRYVNRTEDDMREIEALAAGLKAEATWFTTRSIQECREATGGKGYLAENRFADLKADSDIFTTFEGDNTVLLQLVAKSLLADFRKSFAEDGNFAVLKFLGRRIATAVTEQNAYEIRRTDREHLQSRDFLTAAPRFRHQRLVQSLGSRLRALIKEGNSAYEAGLQCQTHMIAAARAYIDDVVIDHSYRKLDTVEKPEIKAVLEKVIQLHAARTIERNRAWYLESDYISGQKSKAIRKLVDKLCAELRPEAGALVNGFGIPDELLGAPIGR